MPRIFEVEGVVFDIDGTLFDTRTAAIESLRESCRFVSGKYKVRMDCPRDERYLSFIGQPSSELYRNLFPPKLHRYIDELREVIRGHELRLITSGRAKLFPGVRETLARLKAEGFRIAYYSNAGPPYFYTIIQTFKLDEFNVAAKCHVETGLRKPELLKLVKEEARVRRVAVVGDRADDMNAAKANGDFGIGASYGFGRGEIEKVADALIESMDELPRLLRISTSSDRPR